MNTQPLVSVVVPNHNYGHLLPFALASLLAQAEQDFEIVLIENGSTDNSREVIAAFTDKRLKTILYDLPIGVNRALNVGFDTAKGKYLCWMDADDMLPPNSLRSRINAAKNYSADLVLGDALTIDQAGEWIQRMTSVEAPTKELTNFLRYRLRRREPKHPLPKAMSLFGINVWTALYTRDLLARAGGRDQTGRWGPNADYEHALRLIAHAAEVATAHEVTYLYRQHQASRSHRQREGTHPTEPNYQVQAVRRALEREYLHRFSATGHSLAQ